MYSKIMLLEAGLDGQRNIRMLPNAIGFPALNRRSLQ